ncbi:MAG: hypothetical protein ACE5HS_14335 [bacterium]
MWRILKAELLYVYKNIVLVLAIIIPGMLFYFRISETAGVNTMVFPLTIATILQLVIFWIIEKRNRQVVILPISIRQLAVSRLLLFLLPCVWYFGIYFLLYFFLKNVSPRWQHDIYDLLMFLGLILFGCSIYFVLLDLLHSWLNKFNSVEFDLVIFIILISTILLGIPLGLASVWETTGKIIRVMCLGAGIVLLYPAVKTFETRKSYID